MTVVILVSGLPPDRVGGAETQAAQLARHLAARHRVIVYTRTATVPDALVAHPRCTVVRRTAVAIPGLRFAADVVLTLMQLWRARADIDVILAYQSVIDGFIGVLAKRLTGIPVVVSVRSAIEYRLADYRQSRLFAPFVFSRSDRIAVQSPRMAAELVAAFAGRDDVDIELLRRRTCVLPNGIDPPQVTPGAGSHVLFVGRLEAVKGAAFAIDAMAGCSDEHLLVIGDGPERARLEQRARNLPNVSFAGMVPPAVVHDAMARAKLLVVPSLQEGQPNVIIEAMSLGVPVVASAVGGIPELVSDGVTGFLTAPGDVDALSGHIRTIAGDAALRQRLSRAALHAVERYRWPHVVAAFEATLAAVVEERRAAA